MSVLKDDGTKRLIDQILASLKVGKYAIMDKVLNINSKNPVENGVITQAINGLNNRIETLENKSDSAWEYKGSFDYTTTYAEIENETLRIDVDENPCSFVIMSTDELTGECAVYIVNYSETNTNGVANKIFDNYGLQTPILVDAFSNGINIMYDSQSFASGSHHYSKVYCQLLMPNENE